MPGDNIHVNGQSMLQITAHFPRPLLATNELQRYVASDAIIRQPVLRTTKGPPPTLERCGRIRISRGALANRAGKNKVRHSLAAE